jgi:hypothetical protein
MPLSGIGEYIEVSLLLQDLLLARELLALSPSTRTCHPIADEHGVDLVLGGHDHIYYVCKDSGEWENHDKTQPVLGGEGDKGDVLVIKSGTDFRDLSEIALKLEEAPTKSVRRRIIKNLTGKFD